MTQSPTAAEMAQAIMKTTSVGARCGHLNLAQQLGHSLTYQLPPKFGPSSVWRLAISESIQSGRAVLVGEDSQEVSLTWGQVQRLAKVANI